MPQDNGGTATGWTVSPPTRVKRERVDNDEPMRRVSRRMEEANDEESKRTMKQIVLDDLRIDDEEATYEALEQLCDIMYCEEEEEKIRETQREFFLLGGHQAVVRVMKENMDSKKIQHNGIAVLVNATYENKKLRTAISYICGIEAVLAAMEWFDWDEDIQKQGLQALTT